MIRRRRLLTAPLAGLAVPMAGTFATLGTAHAQAPAWPSKPIRLVVPFAAGGATDIYARIIGEHLQRAVGQPVIVDNKPGGNFAIGTEFAAKSPPDGHTLVMITSSHAILEALGINKSKYQLFRDLVPVAGVSATEGVLVIHPSIPANNLREFIAYAKARPGQVNYGSTGTGSMLHLQGELFESMTGTDLVHVPYKTGGTARVDLMEGRLQAMFDAMTGAAPQVRAGKLRALGTTGSRRSVALPDVPTIAEAGVPGYDAPVVIGLMAPTGTPRPIVDRLSTEIGTIMRRPDVREAWAKADSVPLVMPADEFGKSMEAETQKWAQIIQKNKITVE